MYQKVKKTLEQELLRFIEGLDALYSLNSLSPLLFASIKDFILRKGKRLRPALFVIGYRGFSYRRPAGLYRSALALEFLHDFMLVHDDIIDKSETRRSKPSLHVVLQKHLKGYSNLKFRGEDLAIVLGDIMYAMGIHAFLSIKENPYRKEKALKQLIETALYTGAGEFIELLYSIKGINRITKEDIYRIYDLKTARYTFAAPLSMGATLAGAKEKECRRLFRYGIYLGRAFQIKDDLLGMFSAQKEIGKSVLTDLQESKKTLLFWYGYRALRQKDKVRMRRMLCKKKVTQEDYIRMRELLSDCGALGRCKQEIYSLIKKSQALLDGSSMHPNWKRTLQEYASGLLTV